jgi:phosphate uptake regulator
LELIEQTKQTRRLQLSGGSTYIISLPKNWIEGMKIKVGDPVTLVKNTNNSLTLFPESDDRVDVKPEATIIPSPKDPPDALKRKIIAAYLSGYKKIKIRSKGMRIQPEHIRTVRNLVRSNMIGTVIIESSSENITIQVLTRLPELSFDTALNRMHLMAGNMHREAIQALANADSSEAEEVVNLDDEVDRFGLYMRRNLILAVENASILNDMGLEKPADCLAYRAVISRIERIADHAALIAKRVKFLDGSIDEKITKKIISLSEDSIQIFNEAVKALNDHDYILAERVAEKIKAAIDSEKRLMAELKDATKNLIVIRFVLEDIRRTTEYSADIAEVAIDENIHTVITEK